MPAESKARLVHATVALRHTVMAGDPPRPHGPGMHVDLAPDEARRLTAAGFLFDPASAALPEPEMIGPGLVPETEALVYRANAS